MTILETKAIINTYKDASELKQWLKDNRLSITPPALAYVSYKIRGLDPTYSITPVTPRQREDLDTIGLFNNTTY